MGFPDRIEQTVEIAHPAAAEPGEDTGSTSQPPVAYVISAVEGFVDEVTVRRFAELAGPAIEHFGGRFIVSNTEPVVVEGESASAHLSMVEFPSIEHAKAWYDSLHHQYRRKERAGLVR